MPKEDIDLAAREAKAMGARLVNVHGETVVEPVDPGTNAAAVNSAYVDILAHPGLLTAEEARMAGRNGTFLEISARRGHSLTNGHVAKTALAQKASLILDSDAHAPGDLLTPDLCYSVARGAGLSEEQAEMLLHQNPNLLLEKLGYAARV